MGGHLWFKISISFAEDVIVPPVLFVIETKCVKMQAFVEIQAKPAWGTW